MNRQKYALGGRKSAVFLEEKKFAEVCFLLFLLEDATRRLQGVDVGGGSDSLT